MTMTIRTAAVTLILAFSPADARAQDRPAKTLLARLAERVGCGHHRQPAPCQTAPQPSAGPQPGADPYGFAAVLNGHRAAAGLAPLAYDPGLAADAGRNNAAMCRRGLGHHVNDDCFQNCGWNYPDARAAADGWMASPCHRDNMLNPSVTRFGVAHGPGPYWTLNTR